jgi:hypothetical protein
VILDNPNRTPATADFCRMWKDRYRLSNRMLLDMGGTIRRFAGGALPGSIIFDSTGHIRFIGRGASINAIKYQINLVLDGNGM